MSHHHRGPFAPRRLAAVVRLTGAIATSGTYERGSHLIDPHSGWPAARVASASVTGRTSAWRMLSRRPWRSPATTSGLAMVEAIDGYEAMVIAHDGGLKWTDRFPFAKAAGRQSRVASG